MISKNGRDRRTINIVRHMMLAGTALSFVMPVAAVAQDQSVAAEDMRHDFDIAAQPLRDALRQIMQQGNIQVGFEASEVDGKRSAAVSGNMDVNAALSTLLAGTGLTYRRLTNGSVVIVPATAEDDGTVQLPTLKVEGSGGTAGSSGTSGRGDGVASRDAPYRSAASTAHISAEQIQQNRGTSPGDFLRGVAGVLNGDNRNSGALDVNIRGMQGMDRVPVVIDGSLQQSTVYRGYSGVAGRTYLDPDLVGSVTIEKGPSAAADGVGATGGVVRANTLSANDLVAEDKSFGIRFKAGLQGNNVDIPAVGTLGTGNGSQERFDRPGLLDLNGHNFSIAAAHRSDAFDLVGAYARRKTGNYFGGEQGNVPEGSSRYQHGEEVLSSSQDNMSILLRSVIRPSDDLAVDLSYMRYESDFGEMMPSQIVRFGGALQAPLSRTHVNTYTGRLRWDPADNDLVDLHLDSWATDNFTSIETLYRFELPNGTVLNDDAAFQSQSNRWGLRLWNDSRFDTGIGTLALSYGGSYTRERLKPPPGWEDYKGNSGYSDFVEPRDGWRNEYSAYVSGELKPFDWLTLNAAMRYTKVKSHDNNLVDVSIGSSGDRDRATGYNDENNSGFSPIASVIVEPLPGLQFFARYAEAIRAPSLFESTTGFSFYPDPDNPVRAERSRNSEVGLNYQADSLIFSDDVLQARLSYYSNHVDDYLTRGSSDGLVSVINIDSAAFQGAELSLRYDTGSVYAELAGSVLTYEEFCTEAGACREGGTSNSYIPSHLPPKNSLSATLGARLFDERLHVGGRYTHMGDRGNTIYTFGGSTTVVDWEPYDLFDLFGDFRIDDRMSVEFGIDNITDRYYMDALTLGLMPSPGRTFRLGFTGAFGGPTKAESDSQRQRAMESYLLGETAAGSFDGDWSGFYLGATAGYADISRNGTTTDGAGNADPVAASESADLSHGDMQWGAFVGYNFNLDGNWVAGVEADITRMQGRAIRYAISEEIQTTANGFYNLAPDQEAQASMEYDSQWMATARGRIGYKTGRTLFYGTGGLAFLKEKQTRGQYIDTYSASNLSQTNPYGYLTERSFTETDSKTRTGWTLGAGAEIALGKTISLRGEYSYARFGQKDFLFEEARAGVGKSFSYDEIVGYGPPTIYDIPGLGIIEVPNPIFEEVTQVGTSDIENGRRAASKADVHALKIGLSFRF